MFSNCGQPFKPGTLGSSFNLPSHSLFSEHTRIQRLTTTLVPTVAHLDYCNVLSKWAPPLVWSESRGQSEHVAITLLLCSKILSPAGKQPKPLKSPIRPRPMSRPPGTCWPTCSSLLRLSTSRTAVPPVNQAALPHMHPLCCPSFICEPFPTHLTWNCNLHLLLALLLPFAALLVPNTHRNTIYILLMHSAFITQWGKFHKGGNFFTIVGPKIVPSTVSSHSINNLKKWP